MRNRKEIIERGAGISALIARNNSRIGIGRAAARSWLKGWIASRRISYGFISKKIGGAS